MKKMQITEEAVRFLGRVDHSDQKAYLAWSASGVEFTFSGKELSAQFLASALVETEAKQPHIVIFVDGERVKDLQLVQKVQNVEILKGAEKKNCVVRIVKASEAVESVCILDSLMCDEEAVLAPTQKKSFTMEVIGDSITCGYGVNGTLENTFSTGLEDTTKAYAYLAALELDIDLSIVAMSGHGIISGYTEAPEKNVEQLVMPFYDTYGKTYDTYADGKDPYEKKWDFSVPSDLIVINLGTNDTSWCKEIPERGEEFKDAYKGVLKELRSKNPKAQILCILGIMYQTLYKYIELAVNEYREETGDEKVAAREFPLQSDADGMAVDWHPSAITQQKAGKRLAELIREHYQ